METYYKYGLPDILTVQLADKENVKKMSVCKLLFLTLNAVEFRHHFITLHIFITNLFSDVKMNHVRGAVSIRNMAQGSDPSSIGKYENIIIIICILS